jgi:translocation and assembly module TamB
MSRLRATLARIGLGLVGLAVVPALVFGLAQTGPGKALVARVVEHALSKPTAQVTIDHLGGLVPFDMTIDKITVSDARGPWMVIDDAAVAVAPAALLQRRLTLRQLTARALRVERGSQSGGSEGNSGVDLNSLLHPPIAVTIDRLQVERLTLGAALLGEPVTLALASHGSIGGGAAAADLALQRIDGTAGEARLHFAFGGNPLRLELDGEVAEPKGDLLAGLLDHPQPLPLTLHLAGDGPLADWHGQLAATAGREGKLQSELRIRGEAGGYHLAADGAAQVAALLPSAVRPVVGDDARFSAALDVTSAATTLGGLGVTIAAGSLSAQGRYEIATDTLSGTATLDAPDLTVLASLLGSESRGSASAKLVVEGKLAAPTAHLTLAGSGLAFGGNRSEHATAALDVKSLGDPFSDTTPLELSASGAFAGITLASTTLPSALGEQLDWRAAVRIDRHAQTVAVTDLAVADAGNTLSAQGRMEAGAIAAKAHLDMPDVGRVGAGLSAALALDGEIRAAADGSATAALDGTLRPAAGEGSALAALVGPEATLRAHIERLADGALRARDVVVNGADLRFAGEAERAADGGVSATYRLILPRLAAIDTRIAGGATLTGEVSGPREAALTGRVMLSGDGLAFGTARFDDLSAQLALARLTEPKGRIEATFRARELAGSLSSDVALTNGVLQLDRFRLDAVGTRLDGNLRWRLGEKGIDGTLSGTAPDLRPWSELLGTAIFGRAQMKAALSSARGQTADVTIDGKGLVWGGESAITAEHLSATARLAGLLATPSGHAEIELDNAKRGDASVAQLRLTARSARPGRFMIDGDLRGSLGQPFDLTVSAQTLVAENKAELRVTRIAGTLADLALKLRQPLLLSRRGDGVSFADLALGVGPGSLTGAGAVQGAALSLRLHGDGLPLAPLAALGGQRDVTGTVGFELRVSGTRARPQGEFILSADRLLFAAVTRPDLPPLAAVLSGEWRGDRVSAKGRIEGPQSTAVGFTAVLPLALDPKTLAPHLPPQESIAFHLEGDGELANLVDLLPIGEDHLSGRFTVDVSIGGTVAAPSASGRLTLRDGRYESLQIGTVLTGMSFDLVGNRDRLVLQSFTAGDGDRGTLVLAGAVNLAAAGGPAFDVSGQLARFRAIHRDEANVTASGDARLSGNLAAPRLAAKLRVDNADLRVPDRLPPNVQPINALIIDSRTGQTLSAPNEAGPKPWLAAALDVTVDLPGQVFVRGQGLDSEWRGHLMVTGTSAAPQLTGRLEVVRGTYDFLGKSATLSRGTISFLGGQHIDPSIDIEAQVASSDVVAIIKISGTAKQPKITLSSQPDLPQDEILARVLFGTSISQISAAQGLQIAAAAASLATGAGPGVLDRVRRGLGLDRLALGAPQTNSPLNNIAVPSLTSTPGVPGSPPSSGLGTAALPTGAVSGSSSPTTAAVSAGKYVATGVYVGVSQGITAQSSSVNVQVDVTRHISVNTTASQATGAGIGLNWRLDY